MTLGRRLSASTAHLARFELRSLLVVPGIVALLVLAACGQTPGIAVTLDSASAELLRGSSAELAVTLARTGGAIGDVQLAVTGLPANVEASFSTPTLSGGTLASTLVLTAPAAASEGSYDVTVSGTGAGLNATANLTIDVVSLDVSGRVISIYDLPVPGVSVRSQGDSAVTDAQGNFSLSGLAVPYDLAIWNVAAEWVHVYKGFTANELVLSPLQAGEPTGATNSTVVSGNLVGGMLPVGADQIVFVCVEGLDGLAVGCDIVLPTGTSYSVSPDWFTDSTREVRLHALQVDYDASNFPTGYPGYTAVELTLSDGVPTLLDLNLGAALGTKTVTVDVDATPALDSFIGAVQVGPSLALPVMATGLPSGSHDVVMPVIGDASYAFGGVFALSLGWQADVTGTTASVILADDPQLLGPADGATGVTTATQFDTTNTAGGPISFFWTEDSGDLIVGVTAMETTQSIPDLTEFGLALPAAAAFDWRVVAQSGNATEDGNYLMNDYYRLLTLTGGSSPGPIGAGQVAFSATNGFTTAP